MLRRAYYLSGALSHVYNSRKKHEKRTAGKPSLMIFCKITDKYFSKLPKNVYFTLCNIMLGS